MKKQKQEELVELLVEQFHRFFKEQPAIFRGMVNGYKVQFELDEVPENEKELKIGCSVVAPEGREISLKEFFGK